MERELTGVGNGAKNLHVYYRANKSLANVLTCTCVVVSLCL